MNWDEVEQTLFRAALTAMQRFASRHADETFYGFSFDCNADYGEVLLCLNSEKALAEWARRHYPSYSQEEIDRELRWNSGDWKYQGLNQDEDYAQAWEKVWGPTQEKIHAAYLEAADEEADEFLEIFLESVCRVLLRMERENVFAGLNKEPHFKALVTNHDELLEDAWERLEIVRNAS